MNSLAHTIDRRTDSKSRFDFVGPLVERGTLVASVLALYWVLTVCYEEVVVATFSFGGFVWDPRETAWLELALVVVAALLLPLRIRTGSDFFVWIAFMFLLLPAGVLSAQQSSDRLALMTMFGAVALVRAITFACDLATPPEPPRRSRRVELSTSFVVAVVAAVLLTLWQKVGGPNFLSFADVYNYRFDFNDSLTFPLNYLLPTAGGAFIGFLVACALARRRYLTFVALLGCGALFYGLSTHKAMLMYPWFAVFGYVLAKIRRGPLLLVWAFLALAVGVTYATSSTVSTLLGSVVANRLFFIPAQIHFVYFDEFSNVGYQYWSESKIGLGIAEPTISSPAVNYIGEIMTGDGRIGANTGWIATGYMNAGVIGVAVYAAILALILFLIDRWAAQYGHALVVSVFAVPIFSVVSSLDLFVSLLTGGLLLLVMVFATAVRFAPTDSVGERLRPGSGIVGENRFQRG